MPPSELEKQLLDLAKQTAEYQKLAEQRAVASDAALKTLADSQNSMSLSLNELTKLANQQQKEQRNQKKKNKK